MMENEREKLIAWVLSAMAQPNRIKVLEFLRNGERCNCEIYPALGLEQSNLSHHLRPLVDAGLLSSRREGVSVYYRIADKRVLRILDMATEIIRSRVQSEVQLFEKV